MPALRIKWSNLLTIPELDIIGSLPRDMPLADEIVQTIAWLTGVNRTERKFLKCDILGAMLVSDAWNLFNAVEAALLEPTDSTEDSHTFTTANLGVLISTHTKLVRVEFERVSGVSADIVYVPPNNYYWYPHETYLVKGQTVPHALGGTTLIGLTAFN